MNRQSASAGATAALLALLLAGCGGILTSEQPARHHYLLSPYESSPAPAQTVTGVATGPAPSLTLALTAIPGLDSDHILALGTDARLNHYANARWPDHLPEVLASVIRRSLEATGRYADVREAEPGAATEAWALELEVREFYGMQDAGGVTTAVRVTLAGTLACGGESHSLRLFERAPVAEQRLAAVVAAHQAGLDGVTRQLIERLPALCDATRDSQP